jgi:hypothetical protein
VSALLALAAKHWKAVLGASVVLGLVVALIIARSDARHWQKRQEATQAAFDRTVADYRAAAAKARADDLANAARVKTEQQQITERNERAHQAQMADAAARYERLRAKATTYSRTAGTADVSASRDATCLAYAGTGCEAIPALLKAAQDNTDQLVALQAWVEAQGNVDMQGVQ